MATHTYKHATTRLGKVTQIFLKDDDGVNSLSVVRGHHTAREVQAEVATIMRMRQTRRMEDARNPASAF